MLWGPPEQRIGVRRVLALVFGLSPASALARDVNAGWTIEMELAAVNAEVTDKQLALLEAVHAKDGDGHVRDPIHVPRPWDIAPEPSTADEIAEFAAISGGRIVRG